jgi:cytochrome c oxidase subunit 2
LASRTILRRLVPPLLAFLALAVLAAPAEASIFGPRAGHSPNADDIRTAYWVTLVIAGLLFAAINAALVAAVLRFRAGRGRVAQRVASGPGVLLRPAIPLAVIAIGLFVFGIVMTSQARRVEPTGSRGLNASGNLVAQVGGLTLPPDAKQLDITAIGQRWLWRFEYPGGRPGDRVFSYNELVVPVDTAVILHLTATDVSHRWFVPALGGQVDAIPGQDSVTWFKADREGVYPGQSTEFSGTGYAAMRAWVRVVSPKAYKAYVARKKKELASAQKTVKRAVEQNAVPGAAAP